MPLALSRRSFLGGAGLALAASGARAARPRQVTLLHASDLGGRDALAYLRPPSRHLGPVAERFEEPYPDLPASCQNFTAVSVHVSKSFDISDSY